MSRLLAILAALLALCSNVCGGAMVLLPLMDESTSFVTGIVARWTFATDALDTSGNGFHATLTNGAEVAGGSLLLDGTNDYAIVADADALTPTNGITISCWYNLRSLPGNGIFYQIVAKEGSATDRSYYLAITDTAGQKILIIVTSSNGTTLAESRHVFTTSTGVWHHVAFSGSATTNFMFHDGAEVARTSGTAPYFNARLFNNSAPLRIGSRRTPEIDFLPGRVGKVDIYNYALTTNAIIAIYNGGSP